MTNKDQSRSDQPQLRASESDPRGDLIAECDQCGLKQSEWRLPLVVGASCPRHYLDDDSCDGTIVLIHQLEVNTHDRLVSALEEAAHRVYWCCCESDRHDPLCERIHETLRIAALLTPSADPTEVTLELRGYSLWQCIPESKGLRWRPVVDDVRVWLPPSAEEGK